MIFEIGQQWKNPDGVVMTIKEIRGDKVIFQENTSTAICGVGVESVEQLTQWAERETITQVLQ
jgi:predicted lipoprotein